MTISLRTIDHLRRYIKHSTQSFIRYPDTMMTGSCALFSTDFSDFLMSGCQIKNCESCLTYSVASRWLDIGWNIFCRVCSNDIFSRCLDIKWNTPSGIWYITSQCLAIRWNAMTHCVLCLICYLKLTFHPLYIATHNMPSTSIVIPSGYW